MERERRNSATSTTSQTRQTVVPPVAGPSNRQGVTNSRRSSLSINDLGGILSPNDGINTISSLRTESENELKNPLQKADRLRVKKAVVQTTEGAIENITNKQHFIIIGENDTSYQIRYNNWNGNNPEPSERLRTIEGWIAKSDVEDKSTEQTPLGNITTPANNQVQILPDSSNGIKQEDVYQNGVSDCYLQAALIAVALTDASKAARTL